MYKYHEDTKEIEFAEIIKELPVSFDIPEMTDDHIFFGDVLTCLCGFYSFRGMLASDVNIITENGKVTIDGKFDEKRIQDGFEGVHFGGTFVLKEKK